MTMCWVEDDGEWYVPSEIWDHHDGVFPTAGTITLDRLEHCAFETAPNESVIVAVETDVTTWVRVAE